MLVHIGGDVRQSLLLDALPHSSTLIDAEHYFSDLLLLDIAAHVSKPSDPIHADVVGGRRIMSLQQAIELCLVYVLV